MVLLVSGFGEEWLCKFWSDHPSNLCRVFKIAPLPISQAVSTGTCLPTRCLINTRCLAACLDICIMNFQSFHPIPLLTLSPAHTAEIWLLLRTATQLATQELQCESSACHPASMETSAHIFHFPGTQTDQATTHVLLYRQKNKTGKFSVAGNNDGALLLSIFLPLAEGALVWGCHTAPQTNRYEKQG